MEWLGDTIVEMTRQGVNVCLGTDALGSYSQDMFNIMRSAALQQKLRYGYPEAITASQVFDMATINGAKALGLEDTIGSIEPGKKADLVILNLKRIFHQPFHHIEPMLVYSVNRSDIDSVYVDGQPLVKQQKLLSVDEHSLISEANSKIQELWEQADLV